MLPYHLRRQLPLTIAVSTIALGAALLLLVPSGEPTVRAAAVAEASAAVAADRPGVTAAPETSTDEIVTAGTGPATLPTVAAPETSAPAPQVATLSVTPTPIDTQTAAEVDAAAAKADAAPPAGDLVHVGSSAVNVRAGPTTAARRLFVLQPGEAVTAAEVADGWAYARYLNGVPGMENEAPAAKPAAPASTAKKEPRQVSGQTVRLAGPVTLRDGPSKFAARLFTLERGERLTLAETQDGWARVVLPNGVSGWIQIR